MAFYYEYYSILGIIAILGTTCGGSSNNNKLCKSRIVSVIVVMVEQLLFTHSIPGHSRPTSRGWTRGMGSLGH